MYKKNKHRFICLILKNKREGHLKEAKDWRLFSRKAGAGGMATPTGLSITCWGRERGDGAPLGPKGGAWDLRAEPGRKAASPGQGGPSETLTSAGIRVTAALITTAAPVPHPKPCLPDWELGSTGLENVCKRPTDGVSSSPPCLGLQTGRAGGRTSQGQRKCPAESCPLAKGNPISVSSLPPTCSHHTGSRPRGTSEILDGG